MGSQPCLRDQSPIKALDTKAGVSFPAGQYSVCVLSHIIVGRIKHCVCDFTRRDSGSSCVVSPGPYPMCLSPLLILTAILLL